MERPPGSELQKQAIWLYGVLVGLSIKEALTDVFDHRVQQEIQHFWGGSLELSRLCLFLLLIVRFYLGAVQYFHAVYGSANADTNYPTKSFRNDFLIGFGHFVFFCVLGLSVTLHDTYSWLFPAVLVAVLGYNIPWYLSSRKLSTASAIRLWAVVSAVTIAFSALFFLLCCMGLMWFQNAGRMEMTAQQAATCEMLAFIPIVFFSAIDLGALLTGRSAIEEWLAGAIHRPKILGGP